MKAMSKNQGDIMGAGHVGYHTSSSEGRSNPSRNDSFCTTTQRLPSWREFAKGKPILPQSHRYCISMSLEGSSYKNPSIRLKSPNLLFKNQSYLASPPSTSTQQVSTQFHPLMPTISSRTVSTLPLIDFYDLTTDTIQNGPLTYQIARKCNICGRCIARDLLRHVRTHDKEARFKCFYPRANCHHKSGYFHRKYDFKKHLLHHHFVLRDSNVKRLKNLTDKLEHEGTCPCGKRMKAREWLIHIISRNSDGSLECEDLREKNAEDTVVNPIDSKN